MIAKTEELGYAVSTQAKVALVRLKTMQRNADQGCSLAPFPFRPLCLSSVDVRTHDDQHLHPVSGVLEELDDDGPDPPVPEKMECLAHFILTRIQKGRCAVHVFYSRR